MIRAATQVIREIAADHGILSDDEPRLNPDKIDSSDVAADHIMNAVEAGPDRVLAELGLESVQQADRRVAVGVLLAGQKERLAGIADRAQQLDTVPRARHRNE